MFCDKNDSPGLSSAFVRCDGNYVVPGRWDPDDTLSMRQIKKNYLDARMLERRKRQVNWTEVYVESAINY